MVFVVRERIPGQVGGATWAAVRRAAPGAGLGWQLCSPGGAGPTGSPGRVPVSGLDNLGTGPFRAYCR